MNIASKQPTPDRVISDAAELEARRQLAACYRIFARRNLDDLIYTHLSARIPGRENRFLFIPFGMLFEEVTASNLMEDFGALALEPRAFACGHDGDGEFGGGHRPLWSHVRFWTD